MKASASRFFLILAAIFCALTQGAPAQDAVILKNGQTRDGQVLGVRADAIRIKVGPAETSIPMKDVASVDMVPPKGFQDALAAWQKGNPAATLAILKPFVENFQGLPTQWAEQASALLGEVYLGAGQIVEAEKSFTAFQKNYPNAGSLADIGLARLALEKKDFRAAREKLAPISDAAKSVKLPGSGESAAFGQALYLLGLVHEAAAENSEALENYLLVTTLFHGDKAVAAKAAERANFLKEKNVIVP